MTINSDKKGKVGEREFAKLCRAEGFTKARRGQQYSGLEGDDVVGLDGFHVEVKRVEKLNLGKAVGQSKHDAKAGEIAIVAHRKNRCDWLITMKADDWFKIVRNCDLGE